MKGSCSGTGSPLRSHPKPSNCLRFSRRIRVASLARMSCSRLSGPMRWSRNQTWPTPYLRFERRSGRVRNPPGYLDWVMTRHTNTGSPFENQLLRKLQTKDRRCWSRSFGRVPALQSFRTSRAPRVRRRRADGSSWSAPRRKGGRRPPDTPRTRRRPAGAAPPTADRRGCRRHLPIA
jgi:hypothetical protein